MQLEQDTYWQHDVPLFKGHFRYFRSAQSVQVRGKIHTSHEQYVIEDVNLEIVPLTTLKGERIYVNMQPYVEQPRLLVTFGISPHGHADTPALAQVQDAHVAGLQQTRIGTTQAWYYPADALLVLWECFLDRFFLDNIPVTENSNMQQLWQHTEHQLHAQFPQAEKVVSPFSDPLFETKEYQSFLSTLGYESVAQAAYGKLL